MIFVLLFIISIFLAFYVPGRVFLGKIKLAIFPETIVAIVSGLILWAIQGLIFGYMHARWLSYIYILVMVLIFVKEKYYIFGKPKGKFSPDFISILIVAVGGLVQILPYFRIGWKTKEGILFTGHNPSDHIWHGALVKELINHFPPFEPSLSGIPLKDYHYFYNLVTADLIRVFHLPFFAAQFDGMYLIAPILFGSISYLLIQKIYPSKLFTRLGLFLLFFAGNAAGWVMLLMGHGFNWNLDSLIIDASNFVDSPPYSYSLIAGFTGFYLLLLSKDKLPKNIIFLCCILFGTLMEFKIHVGIPFLAGFGAYSFWFILKKKFTPLISFVFAVALAFILLKLNSSNTAGLAFIPFDIPRDFINQKMLGLSVWQLRWDIFYNHHNTIRLIEYGIFMSLVYLFIQFGILLFGLIPSPKLLKSSNFPAVIFLYSAIICAFIFGLLFYQTVGGANIWEFFLIGLPLLSIFLALKISYLLERKHNLVKFIVIFMTVIIVIPQWFITLNGYIKEDFLTGFHGITKQEEDSFAFLNKNTPTNAVIMLAGHDFDSYVDIANLFVDRDIYYSGNGVRQIKTPVIETRRTQEEYVTNGQNSSAISSILRENKISYVYYYGVTLNKDPLTNANLDIVFSNKAATIFHVR